MTRHVGLTLRTVLLLLAVVILSLAIVASGFDLQRRSDMADMRDLRSRNVAALVQTVRRMLLAASPGHRPEIARELGLSGTIEVTRAEAGPPPGVTTRGDDVPELVASVARYVTSPADVYFRELPSPRFWVRQEIGAESWWIVVLAAAPPIEPPSPPWAALLLVLLVLVGSAAAYAATITRAIARLGEAAQRVGADLPDPIIESGPVELRRLARAFNDMLARLREVETERRVLLGGLPHDLRGPLTRLRMRLALLPNAAELRRLHADVDAMEQIVRRFSEFLHPDARGAVALNDLDVVLDGVLESYRSLGESVSIRNTVPCVQVPAFTVSRIVDNLVDNALEHGDRPVEVSASIDRSGMLCLRVSDRGRGIDRAEQRRALQPFTKLVASRGSRGCGLGLAIVRQLAVQHGGDVDFASEGGWFTVLVRLRLPYLHVAPPPTSATRVVAGWLLAVLWGLAAHPIALAQSQGMRQPLAANEAPRAVDGRRDGRRFVFEEGTWFERRGDERRRVVRSVGIAVDTLPQPFTTVWADGLPYFRVANTWFVWVERDQQYVVVDEPRSMRRQQPPRGRPFERRPGVGGAAPPPGGHLGPMQAPAPLPWEGHR